MISFLYRRQFCYDISLHSDIKLTKEIFPKVKDQRVSPIASGGDLVLSEMEWSVDPVYQKDPVERKKKRIRMADMRSEGVIEDKRSYWYKLRTNRCLIPVSGTYEHRAIQGWAQKAPYYIWPKDRKIQFLPGLFQLFESIGPADEKPQIASFGMPTRPANELMANIHNDGEFRHRMPLFSTPELEEFWVSEHFSDEDMQAVYTTACHLSYWIATRFTASWERSHGRTGNRDLSSGTTPIYHR